MDTHFPVLYTRIIQWVSNRLPYLQVSIGHPFEVLGRSKSPGKKSNASQPIRSPRHHHAHGWSSSSDESASKSGLGIGIPKRSPTHHAWCKDFPHAACFQIFLSYQTTKCAKIEKSQAHKARRGFLPSKSDGNYTPTKTSHGSGNHPICRGISSSQKGNGPFPFPASELEGSQDSMFQDLPSDRTLVVTFYKPLRDRTNEGMMPRPLPQFESAPGSQHIGFGSGPDPCVKRWRRSDPCHGEPKDS